MDIVPESDLFAVLHTKVVVNLLLLGLASLFQLVLLEVLAGVDNKIVLFLRREMVVIDSKADGNDRLQDVVYDPCQDIAIKTVVEVSLMLE